MTTGMARRQTRHDRRRNTLLGWWAGIATLAALAWQYDALELWVLPLFAWVAYESCYCPTTCGVTTVRGHPCRNAVLGRLYACKEQMAHPALKRDAIYRLLGLRPGSGPSPNQRHAPQAQTANQVYPPGTATVEPNQQIMLYLTIVATVAGVIQTIWTVK